MLIHALKDKFYICPHKVKQNTNTGYDHKTKQRFLYFLFLFKYIFLQVCVAAKNKQMRQTSRAHRPNGCSFFFALANVFVRQYFFRKCTFAAHFQNS
jgi:hypothetical protein